MTLRDIESELAEISRQAADRRGREAQILADYAGAEVEWRVAWDYLGETSSLLAKSEADAERILDEIQDISSMEPAWIECRRVLPWRPA